MSTSKTYQQSLADAGSETRPPMLERGSYIPWASRFKRFLNRKRENQKWLLKALEDGPYVFRNITPTGSTIPRLQDVEDLQGDDLLYYDAETELMNMILPSIPNEIYNSVDSCKTTKEMWDRVERLMRGTIQNQVNREMRFTNEIDQFVAEPGESLVSVYNRFAQLMNDLERNNMKFPTVSVNINFLNSLQPEWLKYKLVNASRAKKLEKSHDPLALVAHTVSSSRNTSSYYVTHHSSVVDYDEEYEQDDVHNHYEDPLASAMLNQTVVQGDRVNSQSRNSGNVRRNNRPAYVQEEVVEGMNATYETANVQRIVRTPTPGNTSTGQCYNRGGKGHYARNCPKPRIHDSKYFMEQMLLAKQDEAGVILTDEQNDFLFADASRMEEIEELRANICLMARIQPADQNSDDEPSYESAFLIVDNSLTAELATYKEKVELYERRAMFELTEIEEKIDEQLRIFITGRNIKEETLKKELHSVNMQLASTINHNKSMNKVAIGYKNPLCLARAKQVQLALYNGYEIIKNNHVSAIVHNTEDTLKIAEITRRKMNDKMKSPECVTNKESKTSRQIKRGRDTKIPQSSGPPIKVGDEAVHKELGDRMERVATTASSLEAEQDSDTILGDVDAQTRFESTSKQSNDPPLLRGYTLGSGEDSMKLMELMELCIKLSNMLHKNRNSDLIRYALTVNPTIYTYCIQQFWATAKTKMVNGERQIQALIDKKKVIITEISIRSDLYLEDAG
ncbi:integrase, catalytic region, zinc finger, CCHC-type containing protein [Tanacetum coccineum]